MLSGTVVMMPTSTTTRRAVSEDNAKSGRFRPEDPTQILLDGAKAGREDAVNILLERYAPRLRRWATGRLPGHARHIDDTEDLVQDVLIQALHNVEKFEHRQEGAFHSYLRTAILNRIRNRVRHAGVRERAEDPVAEGYRPAPSPLEELIGAEALERYETALAKLKEADRELVVARIEMDCSYEELADLTDRPSANAARMACKRALMRLAQEMGPDLAGGDDDGATQVLR